VNPYKVPLSLLAFLMFVVVVPGWIWFTTQYGTVSEMSLPAQFFVMMSLPATAAFTLVSWLQPG